MRVLGIAVVALVAVAGCAEEANEAPSVVEQHTFEPSVPEAPLPRVRPALQLLPDDLATGVRGTRPALLVATELSSAARDSLASALGIVKWPSREPVGVHVRFEPRSREHAEIVDRFEVVPDEPLVPGWYAATLDASRLPRELAVDTEGSAWAGHLVTRFATHSTTIVSDIDTTPVAGGTEVRVRLSTRVRDARSGANLVRVSDGGRSVTCAGQNDDELAGEDGTKEVVLRCPALGSAEVTVDADLRSLDGIALGDAYHGRAVLKPEPDRAVVRGALARLLEL